MRSTTETGRKAEQAAANYLEMRGYTIIELNWRRPHCETDIIAQKGNAIFFVEVKYRRSDNYGSGLDYVTEAKLKRMHRAATSWIEESKWRGECQLSAVEVAGTNFTVEHFIENIV